MDLNKDKLTHFNDYGRAHMVDVGNKSVTSRRAKAFARVRVSDKILKIIDEKGLSKGDVLSVAQIAGIMGAKKTSELIPMCHPIFINNVDMSFKINDIVKSIDITAEVATTGTTGVEMEALTAVSVASLTVYDMCKSLDKSIIIEEIYLQEKKGGKSGDFISPIISNKDIDKSTNNHPIVVGINISEKKGQKKKGVASAMLIENHGIQGDAHAGDWHRQISLLGEESIDKMRNAGLNDLQNGDFAENITTRGITLNKLPIGTILKIGSSVHKVTQIGKECHSHCEIYHAVGNCVMPYEGIFTTVVKGAEIKPGDRIEIVVYGDE